MLKFDDLYKKGLRPAVFSEIHCKKTGVFWHRDCSAISYTVTPDSLPNKKYYTLSFTYDFRYADDTVSFAYSIPYTYTQLQRDLFFISERYSDIARVNSICKSIAGNSCDMITITENIQTYTKFEEEVHEWGISSSGRRMLRNKKIRKKIQEKHSGKETEENEHDLKQGIVITARVHSGETVGSHMMKGLIDFLLNDSKESKLLRKKFVFKIVPMLNPDGVRYGNYRCSLIGVDLNRRWVKPSKKLHPTIFYSKKMIEVFGEHHKIVMYCDLHGHSKKQNVFMYGCAMKKSMDCMVLRKNLLSKVIPVAMHCRSKFFNFYDCSFRLEKSKKATARIVLYDQYDINHSYTMEASFFGPKNKKFEQENYHMTEKDLAQIGEDLGKSCVIFTSQRLYLNKIRATNDFLRGIIFKKNEFNEKLQQKNEVSQKKSSNAHCEKIKTKKDKNNFIEYGEGETLSQTIMNESDEKEFENAVEEELRNIVEKTGNNEPLIDESIWEGLEIVNYSESDSEDSGGSDSCPSEELEKIDSDPNKKSLRTEEKNSDTISVKIKHKKPQSIQSSNDSESLKKNYSLKPKFSQKNNVKETKPTNSASPVIPIIRSQNLKFSHHLSLEMPKVVEKNEEIFVKINKEKKSTFLKNTEFSEDYQNRSFESFNKINNLLSFLNENQNYKKRYKALYNPAIFIKNQKGINDFSVGNIKSSNLAKNFGEFSRFRLDQLYPKLNV